MKMHKVGVFPNIQRIKYSKILIFREQFIKILLTECTCSYLQSQSIFLLSVYSISRKRIVVTTVTAITANSFATIVDVLPFFVLRTGDTIHFPFLCKKSNIQVKRSNKYNHQIICYLKLRCIFCKCIVACI